MANVHKHLVYSIHTPAIQAWKETPESSQEKNPGGQTQWSSVQNRLIFKAEKSVRTNLIRFTCHFSCQSYAAALLPPEVKIFRGLPWIKNVLSMAFPDTKMERFHEMETIRNCTEESGQGDVAASPPVWCKSFPAWPQGESDSRGLFPRAAPVIHRLRGLLCQKRLPKMPEVRLIPELSDPSHV